MDNFEGFELNQKKNKSITLKKQILFLLLVAVVSFSSSALAITLLKQPETIVYQTPNNMMLTSSNNEELNNVAQVAKIVESSVVEIKTEQTSTSPWLQQYVTEGAGSGVIYSTNGYILTNNHVIEGATSITVKMHDGSTYPATLIATDSKTDVALLKIEKNDCIPAILGNSENLVVGEAAIAVGNPLGELGGTVTNGIISALDREITIDGRTRNLLQTNAAINPGNSGGGLFNANGELIGLVVAKSSGSNIEGLGFAIPVNDVKVVAEELLEKGYVSGRPAMGIKLISISNTLQAQQYGVNQLGVYITEVLQGSAAEKAGLQKDDYLISIEGTIIDSYETLASFIDKYKVGDTLTIEIKRNSEILQVQLTLQESKPQ